MKTSYFGRKILRNSLYCLISVKYAGAAMYHAVREREKWQKNIKLYIRAERARSLKRSRALLRHREFDSLISKK